MSDAQRADLATQVVVDERELASRITTIVLEYAIQAPPDRPLRSEFRLRDQIGLDSFALVSLMLRLGEEFDVDLVEESSRLGMELHQIATFGDLVRLGVAVSSTPR
jgi:acyl carrier protein